jgi:hypothetical protein
MERDPTETTPHPEDLADEELDKLIREATTALARLEAAAFGNQQKRRRVRLRHRDPVKALLAGLPREMRRSIEEGPRLTTIGEDFEHLQRLSLQLRREIKNLAAKVAPFL